MPYIFFFVVLHTHRSYCRIVVVVVVQEKRSHYLLEQNQKNETKNTATISTHYFYPIHQKNPFFVIRKMKLSLTLIVALLAPPTATSFSRSASFLGRSMRSSTTTSTTTLCMKYTVAVVGGGPSGACAAEIFAQEENINTVLFERKMDNAKPCGGAIPLCMVGEFDIPETVVDRKVRFFLVGWGSVSQGDTSCVLLTVFAELDYVCVYVCLSLLFGFVVVFCVLCFSPTKTDERFFFCVVDGKSCGCVFCCCRLGLLYYRSILFGLFVYCILFPCLSSLITQIVLFCFSCCCCCYYCSIVFYYLFC